ncbi:hypothetical protein CEQ90_06360 [Lewinellaceae bacterium SD302]|nr:hypothetical protein CEQ90_06360 [Lewinellaceae bacterium SD302]
MLKATVKASAVTHLTDARYFAAWEVDWLGFDLSPGSGISVHELNAFREWITGPGIVGELDAGLPARIEAGSLSPQTLESLQLDAVQVDSVFGPDQATSILGPLGIPIFVELPVEGYSSLDDHIATLQSYESIATHFVLNFTKGGITWQDLAEGHPFSLEDLKSISESRSVYLEIEGRLPTAIKADYPELAGFSVRGGSEEKVGFKDFDELDTFFEDLEVAG